ncbi:P-loop containing nucleoside triphosphate hydrolase protein [Halteromyces radiatus]|uniref:P-loop containing nucleoside triphosphate hydrolase protein n=1 Tax=Halteromyces radiatus TaxID=101107 RepID=UPI002220FEF4|nr:P-loop containing nucleoside triphosphate hydrolase protein [Halteromyces radiatus]KAI8089998.1 P-loop containing nucleoside triphosphate hydrolase protein [Halteromyces radiatus]
MNEFDLWIPPTQSSNLSHIFNFADIFNVNEDRRVDFVRRWYNDGGIMLMNYDQFRILLTTSSRMDDYGVMLYKPSLVILDEAHRIKNPAASISQCVSKIQTLRRLCLTGYPLQNNLNEYYCMLNFAFPGLLGEVTVFKAIYQKPIESVYADSTLNVRRLAKFKLLELQLMTSDIIHRKDISILAQELPGKTEYYIQCRLTPMQYSTYMTFLEYPKLIRTIMTQLMLFRAICNHPAIYTRMLTNCNMISRHKAVGNINDDGDDLEPVDQDEYGAVRKYAKMLPRDWQKYGFTEEDVKHLDNSHKVQLVLAISKLCRSKKEKLVIVSHSLVCLDFLEEILEKEEFNISKIDGRIKQRQPIIDKFNDDPACEIMLLSARAGGIGVNITGANRVILMDSDWNPSHDEQSIARLYRFGQKNHVYVYRLLTYSTVESTVNTLAQQKRGLSGRVVDNKKGKLQEETATRSYYRTPEKDPVCQVTDQQINELDDKILQQVLQTWKASVVAMNVEKTNHGTSSSLDPMDDHVQPSDSDLADMRRTARFTRANAKSYHQVLLHSFSS